MRGKGVAAAVMAAMLVFPCAAGAQEPQVTGLTATQEVGFTTLKWNPVAGATDYQIERTPVDANDQPTGAATVVGVWQPQRTITPDKPSFAESGYTLGGRYSWRVRARLGTVATRSRTRRRSRRRRCRSRARRLGSWHGLGVAHDRNVYTSTSRRRSTPPRSTPPATACGWSSRPRRSRAGR